MEREYAAAYGLVLGQNMFARCLLQSDQETIKAVGELRDYKTTVVDRDRRRASVPFNPKPPVSSVRSALGTMAKSQSAGQSSVGAGSSSAGARSSGEVVNSLCVIS